MDDVKSELVASAAPVARFLGHSLAVAFGFVGLALISLIPLFALKVLVYCGLSNLASSLHDLENLLFVVDMGVFAVVFLAGVTVFLLDVFVSIRNEIKAIWSKHGSSET